MSVGIHILVDLKDCPVELLSKKDTVSELLNDVVEKSSLTKVEETFHQFQPVGVTGVIVLSESHISIHTWPEKNFAAVDIFCCGNSNEERAYNAFHLLLQNFKPGSYAHRVVHR
ncbi:MAG TPA: adenosylmethionine decarboxylase [Candidatus Nanoarchaeia archaeon]|nr:adenosylmethionine decarboxylase [Candidatus Nanoarchaeia archaeon]